MCIVTCIHSALCLPLWLHSTSFLTHPRLAASTTCGARESMQRRSSMLASIMLPRCTSSHHRLLWMEMQPTHTVQSGCTDEPLRLRLPNLRAANQGIRKHLRISWNETSMSSNNGCRIYLRATINLQRLSTTPHPASLSIVRRSAFACFPITGSASYKSRDMLQLERQRSAITRLLRLSSDMIASSPPSRLHRLRFVHCAEWRRQYHTVCRSPPVAVDPRCI